MSSIPVLAPPTDIAAPDHARSPQALRYLPFAVRCLTLLIALAGITLRVRLYLQNPSLDNDECCVAINLAQRTPLELAKPLDRGQAAPIGFLWAEKAVIHFFGTSEYALRAVPLASGVLLMGIGVIFALQFLPALQGLLFVTLLALASQLIHYSAETKQYGPDATISLLLIWLSAWSIQSKRHGPLIALVAVSALAPWFSHSAIFTEVACVGVMLWSACTEKKRPRLNGAVLLAVLTFASFAACYLMLDRATQQDNLLHRFWAGWMRPKGGLHNVIPWFGRCIAAFDESVLNSTVWSNDDPALPNRFPIVDLIPLAVGLIVLLFRQRRLLCLGLGGLALAFLAANLRLYPFVQRFLLFSLPGYFVVITAGAGVPLRRGGWAVRLVVVTAVFVGLLPALRQARELDYPTLMPSQFRQAMNDVTQNAHAGDIVYVTPPLTNLFDWYQRRFDLSAYKVRRLEVYDAVPRHVAWVISNASGRRFWVLVTNSRTMTEEHPDAFLKEVDQFADRKKTFKWVDTTVARYRARDVTPPE